MNRSTLNLSLLVGISIVLSIFAVADESSVRRLPNISDGDWAGFEKIVVSNPTISDADLASEIGVRYEEGVGVEQSYQRAYEYYCRASEAGSPSGCFRRALASYVGNGTVRSRLSAAIWMQSSAKLNYVPAMRVYGLMKIAGDGMKKDIGEGMKWLEKAAKLNDSRASRDLGNVLAKQFEADKTLARAWLQIAAEEGDKHSLISLAETFLVRDGKVAIDKVGLEWLKMAVDEGSAEAAQILAYCYVKSSTTGGNAERDEIVRILNSTNLDGVNTLLLRLLGKYGSVHEAMDRFFLTQDVTEIYKECANDKVSKEIVEQGTVAPKLLEAFKPRYPPELKLSGKDGRVNLSLVVDVDGTVLDAWVIDSTHPSFTTHALRAAKKWIFSPGLKNGKPVKVLVNIPFVFRISTESSLAPAFTQ